MKRRAHHALVVGERKRQRQSGRRIFFELGGLSAAGVSECDSELVETIAVDLNDERGDHDLPRRHIDRIGEDLEDFFERLRFVLVVEDEQPLLRLAAGDLM